MMLLKKTVYDKLVSKVNAVDISRFVLKMQYNTDKSGIKKQIDDADKKIRDAHALAEKQIIIQRSLELKVNFLVLLA